jgi:hypothetical protein
MNLVTVDVKSAWASKINWTQAVSVLASVLIMFGVNLDAETQAHLVIAINLVSSAVTWVLRTWFTETITPAVAKKL